MKHKITRRIQSILRSARAATERRLLKSLSAALQTRPFPPRFPFRMAISFNGVQNREAFFLRAVVYAPPRHYSLGNPGAQPTLYGFTLSAARPNPTGVMDSLAIRLALFRESPMKAAWHPGLPPHAIICGPFRP